MADAQHKNNKNILITGASRGLGLALAHELARQGWRLIIDGRDKNTLEAAHAELSQLTEVIALDGDVTNPAHRLDLAKAAKGLGGLDAVVNNASTLGLSPQPFLLDHPLNVLEEIYRVNVIAPLGVLQAVRPHLKADARIINVTSDAGKEAYAGWGGYGSSKAAFEQLSAILAEENPNWRVYWIDPGDMQTQMHQEAFPGEDISDRAMPEESVPAFVELLRGNHPSGRYQAQNFPSETHATPIHEIRTVLVVDNLEELLRFYRDGIGLNVVGEWGSDEIGKGFLLDAGHGTLELLDRKHVAYVNSVEGGGVQTDSPLRLVFRVESLESRGNSLAAVNAKPVREIVDTPWGDRNQRWQAPDGTPITIFKPIE